MRTAYSKSKSDAVAKEEGIFVPKHKRKAGEGNSVVPRHSKKSASGPAPAAAAAAASGTGAAAPASSAEVAAPAVSAPVRYRSQLVLFEITFTSVLLSCHPTSFLFFYFFSASLTSQRAWIRSQKRRTSHQTSCFFFRTFRTRLRRLCSKRSSSSSLGFQRWAHTDCTSRIQIMLKNRR